jgi:hypothetical protein
MMDRNKAVAVGRSGETSILLTKSDDPMAAADGMYILVDPYDPQQGRSVTTPRMVAYRERAGLEITTEILEDSEDAERLGTSIHQGKEGSIRRLERDT